MSRRWYVIHTYSGYENKVKTDLEMRVETLGLENKIFKIEIPMENVTEIKEDGRRVNTDKKVFPGYVLVKMDLDDRSWGVVRNTPGVTGFVGAEGKPEPLTREEYNKIMGVGKPRPGTPKKTATSIEVGQTVTAADFEIHYLCPDCHDTGYQGRAVCHCLKQALTDAAFSRFDLSPRARLENFDTFELKYYADDKPEHGPSPRRYMAAMKQLMMTYCADFEAQHDNYLFYGAPGLGKTFLSNCVANALIEKGKNVIYITAEHLINLVREAVRDGNDRTLSDSLSDCDLLIIDDLGAEYQTAFSDDQLFQIINDRILGDGPMLISSNLRDMRQGVMPGQGFSPGAANQQEQAENACGVRVLQSAAITVGQRGKELTDFASLKKAGAAAVSEDGHSVADIKLMREALRTAAGLGIPVLDHTEQPELRDAGSVHRGTAAGLTGIPGIPAEKVRNTGESEPGMGNSILE